MKPSPAVSLLLTNLRLLDYDHSAADAFPVTAQLFTSLTNKGKAFEHIIHHLFHSFDPDECDARFQGCWPVYEPAQARELRNVAFKWLNDLKASGHFRGVMIRRTTLDDCSGDRYEELLLSFSTMVLKDRIENGVFENVVHTQGYQQATSPTPSSRTLNTLLWAHQNAITRLLNARSVSKSEWSSFASYLDEKEREIEALAEHVADCAAKAGEEGPCTKNGYEDVVRNKWRNNWLGDPLWLEIILNGDPELSRDRFLELPFDQAFAKHQRFKDGGVTTGSTTTSLQGLEKQVAEQRRRVDELRKLREEALAPIPGLTKKPTAPAEVQKERAAAEKRGLKLEFTKHQRLHFRDMTQAATPVRPRSNQYTQLLDALKDELAAVDSPPERLHERPTAPVRTYQAPAQTVHMSDPREPYAQEGSRMGIDTPEGAVERVASDSRVTCPFSSPPPTHEDVLSEKEFDIGDFGREVAPRASKQRLSPNPQGRSRRLDRSSFGSADDESSIEDRTRPTKRRTVRNSLGPADDELLAEQIVANIASASFTPEKPSPAKKAPFRALSPIYSPSFSLDDEDQSPLPGGFHQDYQPSPTPLRRYPSPLPPLRNQQNQQNQTRNRNLNTISSAEQEFNRSVTPTEELLVSQDYNSVFKSRPKIALSPMFSPSPAPGIAERLAFDGNGGDGGDRGRGEPLADLDLDEDVDMDTETLSAEGWSDDEVMGYISSPLKHKGK